MDIGERVDHAWSTVSLVVDVVTLSGHQLTGGRLSSSGWPRQPNYLALVVGLRGDMRATEQIKYTKFFHIILLFTNLKSVEPKTGKLKSRLNKTH